jgi:D-glycerate 3-kinase
VPRFDKGQDSPLRQADWPVVEGPVRVILFEGWCVGAAPQTAGQLAVPVNALERDEDTDAAWRGAVNAALAGPYRRLFSRLDRLVLLAAPDFATVVRWRQQQEHALRDRLRAAGQSLGRTMDDAAVVRFLGHYERLVRHILDEMPGRADLVIGLDPERRVLSL